MKKKEVAVISSYYHNWNMGGLLQAYALNATIRKLGYDARHIRFCYAEPAENGAISQRIRTALTRHRLSSELIEWFFQTIQKKRKQRKEFRQFHDRYIAAGTCCDAITAKKLNREADIFVTGSDQIWNPTFWSDRLLKTFGLCFVEKNKRTISYAASIGSEKAAAGKEKLFKEILSAIDYISVREPEAKKYLQPLTEKEIFVAADPTLLLERDEWERLLPKTADKPPYLFAYFLAEEQPHFTELQKYAAQMSLPVHIISFDNSVYCREGQDFSVTDAGPLSFLSFIKNADVIVTNSFHGMVFSVLFHKKFWVYKRYKDGDEASANSRITDFLTEYGLNDRLLEDGEVPTEEMNRQEIDYGAVDAKIAIRREESLLWLKKALCAE